MNIEISSDSGGGTTSSVTTRHGDRSERTVEARQGAIAWSETDDSIAVEIPMPGAKAKDLDVSLSGRRLTVRYQQENETRTEEQGVEQVITQRETLKKEADLPVDVEPDSADAVFKRGVLHVKLRKADSDDDVGERVTVNVD